MSEKHSSPESKNHIPITTLLSWESPGRPFKKRSKQYFASMFLLGFLVEIILFLFSQYTLMAVIVAFIFLAVVLATTPPQNFHYRISNEGIMVEDHFFLWKELYDFYFKEIHGMPVLHIRTESFLPGEITITLGDISQQQVEKLLLPYLPYREFVKPTFMEKSAEWLSKNFPLEAEK